MTMCVLSNGTNDAIQVGMNAGKEIFPVEFRRAYHLVSNKLTADYKRLGIRQ